jgi:hypothetical protein
VRTRLSHDDVAVGVTEPEPLISREEVVAMLFNLADIAVDVHLMRAILEENGEEENQQGET